MDGPEWERWNYICNKAYAIEDHMEIFLEFHRRMAADYSEGAERYEKCAICMEALLEGMFPTTLEAQADEYEECMRAQEIMHGLVYGNEDAE